jgi:glycosyltransferase involved in cell wall biosynthesis
MSKNISIGMVAYNDGEHIENAILSLLGQSYTDFELLISDDSSTDNTLEIAHKMQQLDSRIKVFTEEENQGAIKNFFKVRDLAKGKYLLGCLDMIFIPQIGLN